MTYLLKGVDVSFSLPSWECGVMGGVVGQTSAECTVKRCMRCRANSQPPARFASRQSVVI